MLARYLGPATGIYRGLALLADLDWRWLRVLPPPDSAAVLVSTGAGLGLVRGVLRDYFWPERHLHALFCRRGVLVLAGKVVTIIAFIILGGAAIFGFIPMQDGSPRRD